MLMLLWGPGTAAKALWAPGVVQAVQGAPAAQETSVFTLQELHTGSSVDGGLRHHFLWFA